MLATKSIESMLLQSMQPAASIAAIQQNPASDPPPRVATGTSTIYDSLLHFHLRWGMKTWGRGLRVSMINGVFFSFT